MPPKDSIYPRRRFCAVPVTIPPWEEAGERHSERSLYSLR